MKELRSLIELLGEDLAVRLIEECSGTRVFVPEAMPKKHLLLDVLGEAGLSLMIQYYGGDQLPVPVARAWRIDFYRRRKGFTVREIARRLHCSEAAVYKHLRGEPISPQLSLAFDGANAKPV